MVTVISKQIYCNPFHYKWFSNFSPVILENTVAIWIVSDCFKSINQIFIRKSNFCNKLSFSLRNSLSTKCYWYRIIQFLTKVKRVNADPTYINKAFRVALFLSFNSLCALANFHRWTDDGKLRLIDKQAWVRLFTAKNGDRRSTTSIDHEFIKDGKLRERKWY